MGNTFSQLHILYVSNFDLKKGVLFLLTRLTLYKKSSTSNVKFTVKKKYEHLDFKIIILEMMNFT